MDTSIKSNTPIAFRCHELVSLWVKRSQKMMNTQLVWVEVIAHGGPFAMSLNGKSPDGLSFGDLDRLPLMSYSL